VEDNQTTKKRADTLLVLAAHLYEARGTIIVLRRQISEQEKLIAKLEIQATQRENEEIKKTYGLNKGLKLEKDENGDWWVVEESPQES